MDPSPSWRDENALSETWLPILRGARRSITAHSQATHSSPVARHGRRRSRGRGTPTARRIARAGTPVGRAPFFFRDVPVVGFGPLTLLFASRPRFRRAQGTLEKTLEYQSFTAETEDNEDHTFCGIFFDLHASDRFPVSYLEISSLWVRGQLGPLTVWTRPGGHGGRHGDAVHDPTQWTKAYEKKHDPSFDTLVELVLDRPIRLSAGDTVGVYVHSAAPGDAAIVYDDQRRYYTDAEDSVRDDGKLVILPGTAHLSNKPFGRRAPWGGDALRQGRLFVGRVNYGARWMLWNPETHARFPLGFRAATEAMLMGGKRPECLLYHLGDEVLFYIMNRCSWDWFGTKMREDEEALKLEKRAEAQAAQQKKERDIAEMFGVPVSQARHIMSQMDPYMLQHIHEHLAAGHQIVLQQPGESDEDFEPSESGDEEASESEGGDFDFRESESEAFDDAVEEMEEEEAENDDRDACANAE